MKQTYQKSCGAVVYRQDGEKCLYGLISHRSGHFDFPKGRMRPGESELETASREVAEETGWEVAIDPAFRQLVRYVIQYGSKRRVEKEVVLFLGYAVRKTERPIDVHAMTWFSFGEARVALFFEQPQNILDLAENYLRIK